MANLTPELEKHRKKIEKVAKSYGLDFFETIFEVVNYDYINQFAAYGGFPVRYPHWKFGMEYEHLSKSYEYGLSKIYEMVINTDPCYAYLMEGNLMMDQKLVMAHVYGHCDFFKNNIWFGKTNRKMMDQMANHATRIRRYIDKYGYDTVENFIDVCLSLENLIDRFSPYVEKSRSIVKSDGSTISKSSSNSDTEFDGSDEDGSHQNPNDPHLLKVNKSYMRDYINPPEFVKEQQEKKRRENEDKFSKFPPEPEKDVLKFLMLYSPLPDWKKDIISIIRDESYYFAPQGMTKTMNEGWASYWHSKIMTEHILTDAEIIDFADHHSGTTQMQPNGYNPYKVGIELMRNIEERWNRGQFGREWEDCDDIREKKNWDRKLGLGRQKIFEVRKIYNDVTFIDEFLTEEFCVKNKFFVYKFNQKTNRFELDTRDFKAIKAKLLFHLTNFGQPIIKVEDANFGNRGELLLTHHYEGIDLQPDYMSQTLKNVFKIWMRPVNILTVMDNDAQIFRFDGNEYTNTKISKTDEK